MSSFASSPRILLLHGWCSQGSAKELALKSWGYQVRKPALDNWSLRRATATAQRELDEFQPDVIVGSSRGGAVAMNLKCGETPRILLAPAYRVFGAADSCHSRDVIVHGVHDNLISVDDSRKLAERSSARFVLVDSDHRQNCARGRSGLITALEMVGYGPLAANKYPVFAD